MPPPGIEFGSWWLFNINRFLKDRVLVFGAFLVVVMMSILLVIGWGKTLESGFLIAIKEIQSTAQNLSFILEEQIYNVNQKGRTVILIAKNKIALIYSKVNQVVASVEDFFKSKNEEAFIDFSFFSTLTRKFLQGGQLSFKEAKEQLAFLKEVFLALKSKEVWQNTLAIFSEYGAFLHQNVSKEIGKIRSGLVELGQFPAQFRHTIEGITFSLNDLKNSIAGLGFILSGAIQNLILAVLDLGQEIKNIYLSVKDFIITFFERAKGEEVGQEPLESIGEGVVVIPSKKDLDPEIIQQRIQQSFSDEIIIEPRGEDYGIIKPVFRDKIGESYLYIMVPVYPKN